ncbi:MAG: PrsW family intramembrane metalloprotease [Bacteroidetes bacterium]|nr:MAG: PrsW family intramembrane metalloprotease [Bacteroidota bacterium]
MGFILSAIAPVVIVLFYVYFRDKYDKEPIGLLLKALLAGGLVVLPIILVETWLTRMMPPLGRVGQAGYTAFVVAAFTEELFKLLALYLLVWRAKAFNEQFDGIVYAVFVSLGFAAVENIMYVMEAGYQTAMLRALTAVPAHAIFGITMGYYFGVARIYEELRRDYLRRAFLVPLLLHGIYDFIIMLEVELLLFVFVGYLVYLYFFGFKKMRVLSKASAFKPDDADLGL